jgi:AraC-like DNA-binding protein
MGLPDRAHYWEHPAVPGVDLMRARFVRHRFAPHSHDAFAIGVVSSGAEQLRIGRDTGNVTAGGVVMINPGVVHTGEPADAGGWAYRVLYPDVAVVAEVAGGTPWFSSSVVYDAEAASLVVAAHVAAESGDRLASSSALRRALGVLSARYGGRMPPVSSVGGQVELVRDVLHERLADPPSLGELAALAGVSQFALVRAFRARYGLPPHAYLTQERIRAARSLLDAGTPLARAAVEVGFADQAHLTRHFRRFVGVPPGRYQRKNVQERRGRDS